MTATENRTDFDRCFESTLLGNRQAVLLHKYEIREGLWHVCTIDVNDHYAAYYVRLDRETWEMTRAGVMDVR